MSTNIEDAYDGRIDRLVRANDSLFDRLTYLTARRRRTADELELIEAANFLYVEERRSLLQLRLEFLTNEIQGLIRAVERDEDAVEVILPPNANIENPSKTDEITQVVEQEGKTATLRIIDTATND